MKENQPSKIAYILPSLDAGGAERFILDLIKNLDRQLFTPTLILFGHGGFFLEEARSLGIDLICLRKRFKFDPWNFSALHRAVKKLRPDIVHTQLGGDIYGRLVAHCLKVPVIISTEQNVQTGESEINRYFKAWTAKFATKVVAISRAVKQDSLKRYRIPEDKMELIYNGLEVDKFLVTKRRALGEKIILGSVGRLTPQKNYGLLLEALAELSDYNWEFRLAGEGGLRPTLEQQAKDLGLSERVKFLGLQRDVKGFLSDLDLFILPSLWEGLGIVLLEAGLAGLPVLASKVDGITEIIKDGQTGVLFEPGSKADLALSLKRLLISINQPETKVLGEKLQQDIQKRFDIKTITRQYQDLYLKLIETK